MLAAPTRSVQSPLIGRARVGVAGVIVLALALLVSVVVRQPRVFTLAVRAGGLILAQGVLSMAWLNARRPGRRVWPAWLVWMQAAAAVCCWLVLAWIFWLAT